MKQKCFGFLHALAYSISFSCLSIVLLTSLYIAEYFFQLGKFDLTIDRALYVFEWSIGVAILAGLIADFARFKEDRVICNSEGIPYSVFITKSADEKMSIYKKYMS